MQQTCSECGPVVPIVRSDAVSVCPSCFRRVGGPAVALMTIQSARRTDGAGYGVLGGDAPLKQEDRKRPRTPTPLLDSEDALVRFAFLGNAVNPAPLGSDKNDEDDDGDQLVDRGGTRRIRIKTEERDSSAGPGPGPIRRLPKPLPGLSAAVAYVTKLARAYLSERGVLHRGGSGLVLPSVPTGVRIADVNIIVEQVARVLLRDPEVHSFNTCATRQTVTRSRPSAVLANDNIDAVVLAVVVIAVDGPSKRHVLTSAFLRDIQAFVGRAANGPIRRSLPSKLAKPRRVPINRVATSAGRKVCIRTMEKIAVAADRAEFGNFVKMAGLFIDAAQCVVSRLQSRYPGTQPAFRFPGETEVVVSPIPVLPCLEEEDERVRGWALVGGRARWVRPVLDRQVPCDVHGVPLFPVCELEAAHSFEFRACNGRALFVLQTVGAVDSALDRCLSTSPLGVCTGCTPGHFSPLFLYCVNKLVVACGGADGSAISTFSAAFFMVLLWLVVPSCRPIAATRELDSEEEEEEDEDDEDEEDEEEEEEEDDAEGDDDDDDDVAEEERILQQAHRGKDAASTAAFHCIKAEMKAFKGATVAILGIVGCQRRSVETAAVEILKTLLAPHVYFCEAMALRVAAFIDTNIAGVLAEKK